MVEGWPAAAGGFTPAVPAGLFGMVMVRYLTRDSICGSSSGPPSALANPGIIELIFPEVIQVLQWSGLVGWVRCFKSGTVDARCSASWQIPQPLSYKRAPSKPLVGSA